MHDGINFDRINVFKAILHIFPLESKMQNRTFSLLLLFLICGVLLINMTVYKLGMNFFWNGRHFFRVFRDVSDVPLRDDALDAVITPDVTCAGRDVELVICVPVKRDNSAKRDAIRQTWGSYGKYGGRSGVRVPAGSSGCLEVQTPEGKVKTGEIILVFFTGSSPFPEVDGEQERLNEEAKIHGDIFQDSYIDTYENLTLKSISIFKWISKQCPNTRYAVKVDDDMYLHVPLLVTSLRSHAKTVYDSLLHTSNVSSDAAPVFPPPFMVGSKNTGAKPIRDKKSKWHVPVEAYKDDVYPNYLSGTAYAMSGAAALKVYSASRKVPLFWMEDIYITGLCATLAEVPLIADSRFSYGKLKPNGCTFRNSISGHRYTITQMKRIHKELNNPLLQCG